MPQCYVDALHDMYNTEQRHVVDTLEQQRVSSKLLTKKRDARNRFKHREMFLVFL